MSKLQDYIASLAKLRNISPSSSGSSKTRSPRQHARRRQHEEKHPNDFRRHPSTQERQRRHEKTATKAHPMVSPSATTPGAPITDEIMANFDIFIEQLQRRRRKKHGHTREATTKTAPFSSTSHDMGSTPSATTTLAPYGKMKTSYGTIAKAKTMIHENVPISCAHYAMEEVT